MVSFHFSWWVASNFENYYFSAFVTFLQKRIFYWLCSKGVCYDLQYKWGRARKRMMSGKLFFYTGIPLRPEAPCKSNNKRTDKNLVRWSTEPSFTLKRDQINHKPIKYREIYLNHWVCGDSFIAEYHILTAGPVSPVSPFLPFFPLFPGGPAIKKRECD